MLVGQRMKSNVITASPKTSHREAVNLMRQHKIRRLPVVDHGKLVGIVSEKDLLSTQPSPATTLSVYEIYALLDNLKLEQIMVRPVVTVDASYPLVDAAQILVQRKIGCLPVMQGNSLVGIITETDILRVLVEVLGGGEKGVHFTTELPDKPGMLATISGAVANAGGNIVSITSFSAHDGKRMLAIKEQGADEKKLQQLVKEAGITVVDLAADGPYQPKLVGG